MSEHEEFLNKFLLCSGVYVFELCHRILGCLAPGVHHDT